MKAIALSALTLMCSATLVGELPPQAIETRTVVSSTSAPTNFCGQPEMLRWFLDTGVGRQLQLRQQEALARAVAERETATQPGPTAPQE